MSESDPIRAAAIACRGAGSVLALVALATAAQAQGAFTRRDSAGVEISESRGLGPRVRATEVLRIGEVNGPPETTFYRVLDARLGPDGSIVVLDAGDGVVKVFDRSGALLVTFGGTGEGPAEFASPWQLEMRGDTVRVLDLGLVKVASFDARGELLDTRRIGYVVSAHGFPESFVTRPDGGLYIVGVRGCGFPRRPDDNMWGLFALHTDGTVRDTLQRQRIRTALPVYVSRGRGNSCTVAQWPFAPGPSLAFDPSGGAYRSAGETFEIQRLDASLTRVTAVTRYDVPLRSVTAADRRAFRAQLNARENLARDLRRAVEQAADSAGYPDTWPAVAALKVAGPGTVWARRAGAIGAEQEWDVLTDGRHVGTVVLPAGFRLTDVGADRVLGTITDELDVEYVAVFGVPREVRRR